MAEISTLPVQRFAPVTWGELEQILDRARLSPEQRRDLIVTVLAAGQADDASPAEVEGYRLVTSSTPHACHRLTLELLIEGMDP